MTDKAGPATFTVSGHIDGSGDFVFGDVTWDQPEWFVVQSDDWTYIPGRHLHHGELVRFAEDEPVPYVPITTTLPEDEIVTADGEIVAGPKLVAAIAHMILRGDIPLTKLTDASEIATKLHNHLAIEGAGVFAYEAVAAPF